MSPRAGFTTIEGVVAITLLAIAALGAAGTLALSIRVLRLAEARSAVARLADEAVEGLVARLRAAGGRCNAIGPGSVSGPGGRAVHWTAVVTAGGVDIAVVAPRPTAGPAASDTLQLTLPCR